MVRVYVKVQCGGLVLRLDKKRGIAALSESKSEVRAILVRSVTVISLTLLRRDRHSSLSPYIIHRHLPLSSSFTHVSGERHHDVDEDCDRVTRRPRRRGWVAGRSPISFLKGRSHSCL